MRTALTTALVISFALGCSSCLRLQRGDSERPVEPLPGMGMTGELSSRSEPPPRVHGPRVVVAERDYTVTLFGRTYEAPEKKAFIIAKYRTRGERQYEGLDTSDFSLRGPSGESFSSLASRRFTIYQSGSGYFPLAFEVPDKGSDEGWRIVHKGETTISLTFDAVNPQLSVDLPCDFVISEREQEILQEEERQKARFRECLAECAKAEDRGACVDLCKSIYMPKKVSHGILSD